MHADAAEAADAPSFESSGCHRPIKPQIDRLNFPYRSAELTEICWTPGGENNNVCFLIRLYVRKHREAMRHASRPPPN